MKSIAFAGKIKNKNALKTRHKEVGSLLLNKSTFFDSICHFCSLLSHIYP